MYAVGARAQEVLPPPQSALVEECLASTEIPVTVKPRSRNYRKLPYGSVPGYAPLSMDRKDPETVRRAFAGRLFRDLPPIQPAVLRRFDAFVQNQVRKLPVVEPMAFDEWLEATNYDEQRKEQLRVAAESCHYQRPSVRQASHVKSFPKLESYSEWKNARMINSRCDVIKAYAGRFIRPIEDVVYDHNFDGITFIKHVPVEDRPELVLNLWNAGQTVAETDYKAFESVFAPEFQECCECALFRHCLAHHPQDAEFICRVDAGTNNMKTRDGVRARVAGRRMSGDMWTSLGNGFTNAMVSAFVAHEMGINIRGLVEGDDGLFVTDRPLEMQFYRDLGMMIEMKEVLRPNHAHFCGMVFAGHEVIRDPRRFLQSFGWTHSMINAGARIMGQLLRAKALSACYETPQCPIVGVLARQALLATRGCSPRFVKDGYHEECPLRDEKDVASFNPTLETRDLFALKYGVSVEDQLAVEDAIRRKDFFAVSRILPPPPDVALYEARYVEVG